MQPELQHTLSASSVAVHSRLPRAAHSMPAWSAVTYSPSKVPVTGASPPGPTSDVQIESKHTLEPGAAASVLSMLQHWMEARELEMSTHSGAEALQPLMRITMDVS